MSGFQQFGFGENDTRVGGGKGKRLKMDKGEVARVSFLWWPGLAEGKPDLDAPTPGFTGAPRHYLKGVGYFINQGPEYTSLAGEAAKMRINTIIVKWPMTRQGKLDAEAIQRGDFQVLYWVFDPDKYDEIKPIHGEWHFGSHDLKIKCTDAGFQKMSFSPTKDSILRKLIEKGGLDSPLVEQILKEGQSLLAGVNDEIGKVMSLDTIRQKLAENGGAAGGGSATGSGPVNDAAATEDIDEALDDLLDD
jgi:rubredoxin